MSGLIQFLKLVFYLFLLQVILFLILKLIFSIIILSMELCDWMRMIYMKFNDMNAICCRFGITFVVFIAVIVATNPVDTPSRFTLFCRFVNVTVLIHEESVAKFALDESANLQMIWNQIGKKQSKLCYSRIVKKSRLKKGLLQQQK